MTSLLSGNYATWTVKALRNHAKGLGLRGYSTLNKGGLISLLSGKKDLLVNPTQLVRGTLPLEEVRQMITRWYYDRKYWGKYQQRVNLMEVVSEHLTLHLINEAKGKEACRRGNTGDLIEEEGGEQFRVEVKASSSHGPTSFGPTERWDLLYCLRVYEDLSYKLWLIKLGNSDPLFRAVKVNKHENFGEQADLGRRPRILMESLVEALKDHATLFSSGTLASLMDPDLSEQLARLSL